MMNKQKRILTKRMVFALAAVFVLTASAAYVFKNNIFPKEMVAGTAQGSDQPQILDQNNDNDSSQNNDNNNSLIINDNQGTFKEGSGSGGGSGGSSGGNNGPETDTTAPIITHTPGKPEVNKDYSVLATITDDKSPPAAIIAYLDYQGPTGGWTTIQMKYTKGSGHEGIISRDIINKLFYTEPCDTKGILTYRIRASDETRNERTSQIYKIRIIGPTDVTPPTIFHVPAGSAYSYKDYEIKATITDDMSKPDTIKAYVEYRTPSGAFEKAKYPNQWMKITMKFDTPNQIGIIPEKEIKQFYEQQQSSGSGLESSKDAAQLQYRITAIDEAGNVATSSIFTVNIVK